MKSQVSIPIRASHSPLLTPSMSKATSHLLNPISGRRTRADFPSSSVLIWVNAGRLRGRKDELEANLRNDLGGRSENQ
ncbi:hypothetical protein N7534_003417 [Penicillium rubens]|nr:hypothetical protein N7534_003417 [Penicillium rubens]